MSKINELRTQRAKAWEKAQAFLTANRDERGILSDENVKIYEGLEQDIVNLGKEIDRQERLDAMEREMAAPVSTPSLRSLRTPKSLIPRSVVHPMPTPRRSGLRSVLRTVCPTK